MIFYIPAALLRSILAALIMSVVAINTYAGQASLLWDYTSSGAAGFALYCGTSSARYSSRVDVGNTTSYTITGMMDGATYFCAVVAYDATKAESPYSNEVRIDTPPAPVPPTSALPCPCTIWPATAAPTLAADPDGSSVEVGVKVRADVSGLITGIRFYKSSNNSGTHVAHLWSATGTLLASATFVNETASGWQQVKFATPVAITAGATYVASYHTDVGHYADDVGYFATRGVDSGPVHALQNGADGPNGVYAYGSNAVFPTNDWNTSNYWVDIIFATTP
jgi:hypothetical protein